jgi:hypothetical protein
MPSSVESEIRARLELFVQELTAVIRGSALDLVGEALGEESRPSARRGTAGRAAGLNGRRRKGAKRDPGELAALTEKLGAFIAKTPGQRIEQIGKALGVPTRDLALPVKKLIAAKRVSTKGQKRATTYYGGGRRTAKKPAGKRSAGKRRTGVKKVARRAPKRAAPKVEATSEAGTAE